MAISTTARFLRETVKYVRAALIDTTAERAALETERIGITGKGMRDLFEAQEPDMKNGILVLHQWPSGFRVSDVCNSGRAHRTNSFTRTGTEHIAKDLCRPMLCWWGQRQHHYDLACLSL